MNIKAFRETLKRIGETFTYSFTSSPAFTINPSTIRVTLICDEKTWLNQPRDTKGRFAKR